MSFTMSSKSAELGGPFPQGAKACEQSRPGYQVAESQSQSDVQPVHMTSCKSCSTLEQRIDMATAAVIQLFLISIFWKCNQGDDGYRIAIKVSKISDSGNIHLQKEFIEQ